MIKSFNNFWVVKLTCKVFLRLMLSHIDNSIYKISFIVLFHIDNKRQHTNRFNSNINFNRLKQIIKKMMFAWSIFDIINNVSRWMLEAFPDKKEDFLTPIKRNAERLYKLTQDILDVAKIELGNLKIERTTFDMNEKINNVIKDLTPKKNLNDNIKNQQNVKFIFQPLKEPIMVFADKQRIYQVISNLVKNALKFIPSNDGKIEIILEKIREGNENEFVSVKIRDNGIGIDSQILPRLFQKFTTKPESGGTGLGLYISKSIVEAHGGKIWTENNSNGKGATFRFTLPIIK